MSATAGYFRQSPTLPDVLTPLLGRHRESVQLVAMLSNPAHRLVTVTGPGGVGKTRLALHVAASVVDAFEDEVVFVSLASIHEPMLVLMAIGQSLGVFRDVREGYEDQLVERLQGKTTLLVLDNLEQVLDVAPAMARVLSRCPDLTILATSQAPLGLGGEQLYPLRPLTTPPEQDLTTDDILQSDAVALFVQRALAVNPQLEVDARNAVTIAEICRKLDGLPLAIELAAARTNILSIDALLARLSNRLMVLGGERRDVPDRLRTMRSAIAWSYDLLSEHEQEIFRRLVVFADGFSLDAIETIFVARPDDRDAYDILATLVDRSLIQSHVLSNGDARFLILETLRDFGLEQLELLDEAGAARHAHALYITQLAEQAEPNLVGSTQDEWLDRLDTESENIRAAAEWSLANDHSELVLRICGSIWRFLAIRGLVADGRHWLKSALNAYGDGEPSYRINALIGAGNLAEDTRDLEDAEQYFERARCLAAASGNLAAEGRALLGLGTVAHDRSDFFRAFGLHKRATALAREAGDARGIAIGLGNMGTVSYYRGDIGVAIESWEESCAVLADLGDIISESLGASNIGAAATDQGDYERAERYILRSLDLQRQLNTQRDLPFTLINLAEVARVQGDYTLAHDALAESVVILRQYGNALIECYALTTNARLALSEGDVRGAAAYIVENMRLYAGSEDQNLIIETADVLAAIALAHGSPAAVLELITAANQVQASFEGARGPVRQEELERAEAAARAALSAQDCEAMVAAGNERDIDTLRKRITIIAREIAGRQYARVAPSASTEGGAVEVKPDVEHSLTTREIEILRLLAEGLSTKEISDALFISSRTTGTHITNILNKLNVSSRTAAVAFAMRSEIV